MGIPVVCSRARVVACVGEVPRRWDAVPSTRGATCDATGPSAESLCVPIVEKDVEYDDETGPKA